MDAHDVDLIGKAFGPVLAEMRTQHAELRAEVAALKRELMELQRDEKRTPADWYRGVWREGEAHLRGESVTDHGALWMCLADTSERPGTSDHWKMTAKANGHGRYA
jgi:hypothetical protein